MEIGKIKDEVLKTLGMSQVENLNGKFVSIHREAVYAENFEKHLEENQIVEKKLVTFEKEIVLRTLNGKVNEGQTVNVIIDELCSMIDELCKVNKEDKEILNDDKSLLACINGLNEESRNIKIIIPLSKFLTLKEGKVLNETSILGKSLPNDYHYFYNLYPLFTYNSIDNDQVIVFSSVSGIVISDFEISLRDDHKLNISVKIGIDDIGMVKVLSLK